MRLPSEVVTSRDRSITVVVTSEPTAHAIQEWDELVDADPQSDVTQLSCWARLRATVGFEALHVLAYRGNRLAGGAQILARRIPVMGAAGYIAHGPVLENGAVDRDDLAREIAAACARVARTLRVLVVQPLAGTSNVRPDLLCERFRPSSVEIAPAATLRLDLSVDEDELRAGLQKRLRTWTGRWEARGVRVRTGSEEDAGLLARLMAQSAQYQQYQPFSADYVRTMYRELAQGGHAEVLVGEADGEPVAASLFTVCGGTVRFRLTGFDRTSDASRLKVPAAIMWDAIKRARTRGHHTFDLGGLSARGTSAVADGAAPDPSTLDGPDFFKAGFGGGLFTYPAPVELIASPAARAAYDYAKRFDRGRAVLETVNRRMRGRWKTGDRTT